MSGKKNNIPNSERVQLGGVAPRRLITSRDQSGNTVAPKRILPNLERIQIRTKHCATSEDLLKNSLKRKLLNQLGSFNDNISVSRILMRSEHLLYSDLMAFFSTHTSSSHSVVYELLFDIEINEYLFKTPFQDMNSSIEAAIYLWDAYFNSALFEKCTELTAEFELIVERLTLIGEKIDQAQGNSENNLKVFAKALIALKESLFKYLMGESNALMEKEGEILKSFLAQ